MCLENWYDFMGSSYKRSRKVTLIGSLQYIQSSSRVAVVASHLGSRLLSSCKIPPNKSFNELDVDDVWASTVDCTKERKRSSSDNCLINKFEVSMVE